MSDKKKEEKKSGDECYICGKPFEQGDEIVSDGSSGGIVHFECFSNQKVVLPFDLDDSEKKNDFATTFFCLDFFQIGAFLFIHLFVVCSS